MAKNFLTKQERKDARKWGKGKTWTEAAAIQNQIGKRRQRKEDKKYLGSDSIYQQALASLNRVESDVRNTEANSLQQLALDQRQAASSLDRTKETDLLGIRNDFAGRGMGRSTGAVNARGEYIEQLQQKHDELTRSADKSKNQIVQERQAAESSIALQRSQAAWDALRRRIKPRTV